MWGGSTAEGDRAARNCGIAQGQRMDSLGFPPERAFQKVAVPLYTFRICNPHYRNLLPGKELKESTSILHFAKQLGNIRGGFYLDFFW